MPSIFLSPSEGVGVGEGSLWFDNCVSWDEPLRPPIAPSLRFAGDTKVEGGMLAGGGVLESLVLRP